MLKLIQFGNMGLSGLNTDLVPWDLPIEFLTEGRNFRVRNNAIEASGGWVKIRTPAESDLGLSKALPIVTGPGDIALVAGKWGLYSWDGLTYSHLYTHGSPVDASLWSFARMGGIPIACHPQIGIFYWNPVRTATDATDAATICQFLPYDKTEKWDQPSIRTGNIIRQHKTFLFLLNLRENGVDMPDSFRWSHPAPVNAVPVTWDAESADAQYFMAGIASLGANSGPIIDGLSMRDNFVIYSTNTIDLLQERGDVNLVWDRRQLTSYTGLLAMDAVCEVKGSHFLMTPEDIIINDGNSLQSIAHKRIRNDYVSKLVHGDRYKEAFVVNNLIRKEVWFCIATSQDLSRNVDLAYIYNWKDDSWAIRDLQPETLYAYYGPNASGILTWDVLKSQPTPLPWESGNMPWLTDKTNPFDETVMGISSDSSAFYDLDPGSYTGVISNVLKDTNLTTGMKLVKTNIPLGDHRGVTTISRVYLHAQGSCTLRIRVGSQDYAGSEVRWKVPVLYRVDKSNTKGQRKIDVRTTGELHAFEIELVGDGNCQISGMSIEYAEAGLR